MKNSPGTKAESKQKSFQHFLLIISALILLISISGCGKETASSDTLLRQAITLASKDGNWEESLEYAERAVNADSQNINALIMYALALEHSTQINKAKTELRKAISINPNNFMAQLSIGKLLYQSRDYEGAYEYLTNAYKLDPNNIDALILFAQCSAKLQTVNTDQVFQKLAKTEYYKNKPEIYNELGTYYAKANNLSKAAQNLTEAYKLAPNNPIIVVNLGVFCDKYLNKPKKARFFYRKFISLTDNNPAFQIQKQQVTSRIKQISRL